MDFLLHQFTERFIDGTVALDDAVPSKRSRYEKDLEVAAARGGAGVTLVKDALVYNLQVSGREMATEEAVDFRGGGFHGEVNQGS